MYSGVLISINIKRDKTSFALYLCNIFIKFVTTNRCLRIRNNLPSNRTTFGICNEIKYNNISAYHNAVNVRFMMRLKGARPQFWHIWNDADGVIPIPSKTFVFATEHNIIFFNF